MRSAWETRKRGSATYGNNSETAYRQNAAKKRPPCTRAAEKRGRGEREQGGRAELGAVLQLKSAQARRGPPAKDATRAHQEEPR